VPLERLNQAKRSIELVDLAIDLGIALESLFLQEKCTDVQLALTFRLRAAWFLSGNDRDLRRENFDLFGRLYKWRSKAIHEGTLDEHVKGIPIPIGEVLTRGEAAQAMDKIIRLRKFPNWKCLVLGME